MNDIKFRSLHELDNFDRNILLSLPGFKFKDPDEEMSWKKIPNPHISPTDSVKKSADSQPDYADIKRMYNDQLKAKTFEIKSKQ